ncbi:MAG: glycosyltransferase family 39 protein, partial [Bacteroidota bacterium]|nr:glycosyltransferase family 39 protein [Bacteroidota bacterium]
ISDWLFGVNYWFPRVLGIAVQSAGIFWLFKIATNTMDHRAGMFAIMFYGLSLLWRSTGGKYVSYTETYAITCIIISVYFSIVCSAKRHAFIGGVFSGLGLGFRLTAIFGILPMMIFTLKKDSKSALYYFGGIMASIAFLILSFSLAGIKVNDFLFYGLADNFGAGSVTARSFAWKSQQFANGFFYSEIILFYPAIIVYFILKRKIDFLEAWLVSEFCGIIILGTYDPSHFKNLLPVMSLISAFVVSYLIKEYHAPLKYMLLIMGFVFFPKTFEPLFAAKKFFLRSSPSKPRTKTDFDGQTGKREAGLWIRSHTLSNDKVFVAGYCAEVMLYSERVSPSIYFNATQTLFAKKHLFVDLLSEEPAMILIPLSESYSTSVDSDIRLFIRGLVGRDYKFDTCVYNYSVYRHRR